MASAPHESTVESEKLAYTDWFTLHLDLKPDNLFLGKPYLPNSTEEEIVADPTRAYPRLVIGDFGHAHHTSTTPGRDPQNPEGFRQTGTRGYRPPEQSLPFDPDWDEQPIEGRPRFPEAINTWATGKVLFDLLSHYTGDEWPDYVENLMINASESEFEDFGNHVLEESFATRDDPNFTQELRTLVRKCLSPIPADRPTHRELGDATLMGLQRAINEIRRADSASPGTRGVESHHLYFKDNEINNMNFGSARCGATEGTLNRIIETEDPDHPLSLPQLKWKDFQKRWNGRKVLDNDEVIRPQPGGGWRVTQDTDEGSNTDASGGSESPRGQSPTLDEVTESQQSPPAVRRGDEPASTEPKRGSKRSSSQREPSADDPPSKRPSHRSGSKANEEPQWNGSPPEEISTPEGPQIGQSNPQQESLEDLAGTALRALLQGAASTEPRPPESTASPRPPQPQDEDPDAVGDGSAGVRLQNENELNEDQPKEHEED